MPTDRSDGTGGTSASAPALFPVPGRRPGRIASDRASTIGVDLADRIAPWLLGLITLVARLATAATGPTDWDSSQYAAAVSRFDVTHGRPQPPGYFLYVAAGRLVHLTGLGVVPSLVVISAVVSAVAVGLVVVAGRDLGGRWVGLAAGVVVATSPFAWFSGSVVATYSFDLMTAPLLIILAWRARPHSWHGAGALVALGLSAGFRQSTVQTFALLALVAVVTSVRRVREAVVAVVAGAVAVAAWFVPVALLQPGGASAWARAAHIETLGALRSTSVLDHAVRGATNIGTFAAYTTLALGPVAAVAVVAGCVLAVRAVVGSTGARRASAVQAQPDVPPVAPEWRRPWYRSRIAILTAAVVPPMAVVALIQFAKGGYLLAYLPGGVIALLLVPAAAAAPGHRTPSSGRRVLTTAWLILATLAVGAVAAFGAQRFLSGDGVLPVAATQTSHGLWLTQARYQAPYPDTLAAIRSTDAIDGDLAALAPHVDGRSDVVVIDSVDGGMSFYRNAGWALPGDRVALITPGAAIYNELGGSLFYTSTTVVPVGPGGDVLLIAPPDLTGLAALAGKGEAVELTDARPIADFRVWRITPGASILGVRVVMVSGPRRLGSGITG